MTAHAETILPPRPPAPQQSAGRPWARRGPGFRLAVLLGTILPPVPVIAALLYTDWPPVTIFVAIYLPLQLIAACAAAISQRGTRAAGDAVIIVLAIGATLLAVIVLGSILSTIAIRGYQAMSVAFLTQNTLYISPSTPLGYGGVGAAVLGTFIIVALATVITVPIGIATAVYVTEVRGRAVPYVRFFVQAMSGVPSVVAGLFILVVLILSGALAYSALAGALAYSILMLPTVARTAEEVLKLVPEELRTGALALGSTRARVVGQVVLPAARTGIVTATILGIARVVGETAPLLLTSLSNDRTIINPVGNPIASLPVFIFDKVSLPFPDAVARAWGAALVLMVIVAILFTAARLLSARRFAKS
ncbi:MAG: phosphate ABC transporter permease PstA [Actinomycetales bacterium]|nr:phosphate ABC transporter permease PstA [Actinomycetales bacterium]